MDLTPFQQDLFPSDRPQASLTVPVSMTALGGGYDFAGGMSLMIPTQQRARVQVARRSDGVIQLYLASGPQAQYARVPIALLSQPLASATDLAQAVERLTGGQVALPFVAVLRAMVQEAGLACAGLDIWLSWSLPTPLYPGLRRALQTGLVIALTRHAHLAIEGVALPLLAWRAAQQHGDPVGPQDFLANFYQKDAQLLPVLSEPGFTYPPLGLSGGPFPVSLQLAAETYLPGLAYHHLRTACAMGYALIARASGASHADLIQARETGELAHLPLSGQLAQLSVAEFERHWRDQLPLTLSGAAFLRQGLPLSDAWVQAYPQRSYPVQAATAAAIYANERQSHCLGLLRQLTRQPDEATYAALRHTLSELSVQDQPVGHEQRSAMNDLLGRLDSYSSQVGLIGLVPVRGGWERSYTLWLRRPLAPDLAIVLLKGLSPTLKAHWLHAQVP